MSTSGFRSERSGVDARNLSNPSNNALAHIDFDVAEFDPSIWRASSNSVAANPDRLEPFSRFSASARSALTAASTVAFRAAT